MSVFVFKFNGLFTKRGFEKMPRKIFIVNVVFYTWNKEYILNNSGHFHSSLLSNSRWLYYKERPNRSLNNGDMDDKGYVVSERDYDI